MKDISIAIVDDSAFIRKALVRLFSETTNINVVGTAGTGEELLENLNAWKPDVIILDLFMPGMGGLATLDRIIESYPARVIIMSTHSQKDTPLTIEALHKGAVDFIDKQEYSLVDFGRLREVLLEKIISVTGGSFKPRAAKPEPQPAKIRVTAQLPADSIIRKPYEIILIGASTGGPPAIQEILAKLGPVAVPVVIVQHMPVGFTKPFADRLNAHMPMRVCEAVHGEELFASTVYIAPSGQHLRLKNDGGKLSILLTKYPENVAHRPSVDVLFDSAVSFGKKVIAVLLTGMGSDGADGMANVAKAGAYTIAQDESSCVVYGMPKAAVELHCVKEIIPLSEIGGYLKKLVATF